MENYPKWLYHRLISDFPWNSAKECTFSEFTEIYSLHDSHWEALHFDVAYDDSAILIINWDIVWLPDNLKKKISTEEVFLLMKIENVSQVSISGYEDLSTAKIQRTIGDAEIEKIDDKNLLVISDVYGASVEIVFSGKMRFLAMNGKSEVIAI